MARPLTKPKDGAVYFRPATIESHIDQVTILDMATLKTRLAVTDPNSPLHVRPECLVHLVREAMRSGDEQKATAAMKPLLKYCEAILRSKIRETRDFDAATMREEILEEFSELVAANTEELDFFECKFDMAFFTFRASQLKSRLSGLNRAVSLTDLPVGSGAGVHEDAVARVTAAFGTPPSQENAAFLTDVMKVIKALPAAERTAVMLRAIGHSDEEIAARLDCSDRSVRNYLARATAKLANLKEDT